MTVARVARLCRLGLLVALAGCDLATGPVIGDWRGVAQTISDYYYARIELILDGPPGATSGEYHYNRLNQQGAAGNGQRYIEWGDRWTSRVITVDGKPATLVHLANLPDASIPNYLLLSDGRLVPEADLNHIDLTRAALRFALAPVPRDTFGYGRP